MKFTEAYGVSCAVVAMLIVAGSDSRIVSVGALVIGTAAVVYLNKFYQSKINETKKSTDPS